MVYLLVLNELKSYFLSQNPEIRDGEKQPSHLNRLIAAFKNAMVEAYLTFLHSTLPLLINLNLLLQRRDPIIHLMYNALFDTSVVLLSRFMSPEIVSQYKNNMLDKEAIKAPTEDLLNYLTTDKLFVGFLARSKVNEMLSDGTISDKEKRNFFDACLCFHKTGFLYALNNFPLKNDLLKHVRVFNFLNQKCSFESIRFLLEQDLKYYISFSPLQLVQLEEEFILLQSITLEDFSEAALSEASIRVDGDGQTVTYRIEVLWYYLYMMKVAGTNRSKFENLFKMAKVVLAIVHSNADEESMFSHIRKNLTPQRASLNLDGTLSSIVSFQLNRPQGESCYMYKPSSNVIEKAKKAT